MSDDRNFNTPSTRDDFDIVKEKTTGKPDIIHGIATKAEVEKLEQERKELAPQPQLTIGGTVEQVVHEKQHDEAEARIRYVKGRLNDASKRLQKDFDRGR